MTDQREDIYGEFWSDLAQMIDAYLECALWSSNDPEDETPLDDHYSINEISEDWLKEARSDCYEFLVANEIEIGCVCMVLSDATHGGIEYGLGNVGHDFWLTRNRHGAGFWDRYHGKDEMLTGWLQELTEASHVYGEVDLFPIGNNELG